ncbi:MAG: hypothetical protein ACLFT5_09460, partial [Desulfovermiculus sp.]
MVDSDQQDEHLTQILELLFQESSAQPEELQKMMYEEGSSTAFLSQLVGAIQHMDLNSQPNQGQAHAAKQVQDQGTAQGQGLNREASSELSQLLTRMQTLMAKAGSNSQPNQGQA